MKGILSQKGKPGKRGIRVYPPWETDLNKQAAQTQKWQTPYFVFIQQDAQFRADILSDYITRLSANSLNIG